MNASKEKKEDPKPLTAEELKKKELRKLKKKRAAENKKRKWFESKENKYVYVQNVPVNATVQEIKDFFARCGVVKIDPQTGDFAIKIYTDEDGKPKGDCRVGYENYESVDMAVEWLNDNEIRPGYPLKIEKAQFQQKGDTYQKREIKKLDKVEKLRIKAEQERQHAWNDD